MQLQDACSISKVFIGIDIHKKVDSFYPNRLIFSQDLFDAFYCRGFVTICGKRFPNHAVDLVYEGLLRFSAARYFLNLVGMF
jgi:hypothetical protein